MAKGETYEEFVEKFKPKKTTDDCYTPDNIYDAIADWVAKEYGLNRENFVRPFYPGGDYQREDQYTPESVVVDNPPFSILAEICRWYGERGIRFFLFAPTLTLFSADNVTGICHIAANCKITYENGALVNTSFKTNLEPDVAVRTAPELTAKVKELDEFNTAKGKVSLKYAYPRNIITAAQVGNWSEWGVDFKAYRNQVKKICVLDAQKEKKLGIFGAGFLCSDMIAAKAAKAAKAAIAAKAAKAAKAAIAAKAAKAAIAAKAAKAAIAAGIPEDRINEDGEIVWELSEREREIVEQLNENI